MNFKGVIKKNFKENDVEESDRQNRIQWMTVTSMVMNYPVT
jgi:hypothetical protein